MSGAGIVCCRICGHRLTVESDRIEGALVEREERCPGCDLYHHRFNYGHTEERVGVILSAWSYDESGPANWREQEAEAKRIWESDQAMAMVRAGRDRPDDDTPRLALADWCDDNGCPLSAAYLRGTSLQES